MKKQIITISGIPGSGKSSTSDLVAKELAFRRFSSGDFFRKIGLELGISLNDVSKKAETHEEVYEKIIHRLESEKKRYKELYGVDHTKKENFNLVIDTNKNGLEQVADIIVSEYKKWLT